MGYPGINGRIPGAPEAGGGQDAAVGGRRSAEGADESASNGGRRDGQGVAGTGDGAGWVAVDGELGMTRPRTATRRWDRPGPLGDDEVIAKTLLSRSAVASTLSNR